MMVFLQQAHIEAAHRVLIGDQARLDGEPIPLAAEIHTEFAGPRRLRLVRRFFHGKRVRHLGQELLRAVSTEVLDHAVIVKDLHLVAGKSPTGRIIGFRAEWRGLPVLRSAAAMRDAAAERWWPSAM